MPEQNEGYQPSDEGDRLVRNPEIAHELANDEQLHRDQIVKLENTPGVKEGLITALREDIERRFVERKAKLENQQERHVQQAQELAREYVLDFIRSPYSYTYLDFAINRIRGGSEAREAFMTEIQGLIEEVNSWEELESPGIHLFNTAGPKERSEDWLIRNGNNPCESDFRGEAVIDKYIHQD